MTPSPSGRAASGRSIQRSPSGDSFVSRRSALRAAGAGATAPLIGAVTVGAADRDQAGQSVPPRLAVDGNRLVTSEGERVTLRGLNVIDPKRANTVAAARGRDAAQQLDLVTDDARGWHPDVIRLPVTPVDLGEHPPGTEAGPPEPPAFDREQLDSYLETHLDPIVEQCAAAGVYAIVDFHRHWEGLPWGDREAGTVNEALRSEVVGFWEAVAPRYADRDHVLYEVYNEPTQPGMWGHYRKGWVQDVWGLFLEFVQPIVDEVRAHADTVTLVSSPGWSQSPEGALIEPVDGENLAYTYHVYPGHEASEARDWEDSSINGGGVEGVYEEVPLFVTEFGWRADGNDLTGATTSGFGRDFLEWLEHDDAISWAAWCADPFWGPRMFEATFDGARAIGDPYGGDVPEACTDMPCEWALLGRDAGSSADMGEYVRQILAADGVPEGYFAAPDDGTGTDTATERNEPTDTGTDAGSSTAADSETVGDPSETAGSPNGTDGVGGITDADGASGFGVVAGLAGVAGGLAATLRRRGDATGREFEE